MPSYSPKRRLFRINAYFSNLADIICCGKPYGDVVNTIATYNKMLAHSGNSFVIAILDRVILDCKCWSVAKKILRLNFQK